MRNRDDEERQPTADTRKDVNPSSNTHGIGRRTRGGMRLPRAVKKPARSLKGGGGLSLVVSDDDPLLTPAEAGESGSSRFGPDTQRIIVGKPTRLRAGSPTSRFDSSTDEGPRRSEDQHVPAVRIVPRGRRVNPLNDGSRSTGLVFGRKKTAAQWTVR